MTRRIGFLAFDGVQTLDLVGPADAFTSDAFAELDPAAGQSPRPYEVVGIGPHANRLTPSAGIVLHAHPTVPTSNGRRPPTAPGGPGNKKPR